MSATAVHVAAPDAVDTLAEKLSMGHDPARAERAGAESAWTGFGEYDDFDDAVSEVLTLVYDFGEWPHWAYWAGRDTDGHGLIAEYCEGDWYLYRFATGDAAETFVASQHT